MAQLAALVRRATAEDCDLEAALFGQTSADSIAQILGDYVSERLSPIAQALFYRRGTGIVLGVRLTDGREVVLKAHRWRVTIGRLTAVQKVQTRLARGGLPAPGPILSPATLGSGIVTVEELLTGHPADATQPAIRREMAASLFAFVAAAGESDADPELGVCALLEPAAGSPYPEPHDLRFDFVATAAGAGWIDELAWQARTSLDQADSPLAVGHLDWQAGNLGFSEGRVAAIYDWDSVSQAPEPVIVGAAAAQFSTDWTRGVGPPQPGAMERFVFDYEAARRCPFDSGERELLEAANLLTCAYGARCEHSDKLLDRPGATGGPGRWAKVLQGRASAIFGRRRGGP